MSVLSWNCRGLHHRSVKDAIRYVIQSHRCNLVFLQDMHSDANTARRMACRLGRGWCSWAISVEGASGGIALLWN